MLDVGGPDGAETREIHTAAMKGYVRGSTAGVYLLSMLSVTTEGSACACCVVCRFKSTATLFMHKTLKQKKKKISGGKTIVTHTWPARNVTPQHPIRRYEKKFERQWRRETTSEGGGEGLRPQHPTLQNQPGIQKALGPQTTADCCPININPWKKPTHVRRCKAVI